ncbi:BQ2448_730 [Microbotryum intermedium]|uniref:BQ2448_730 protein n=1 Tax=Microbotryum intermedium TaxID=269621 RepID=A0A238F785_9BASI|nr:BQ2448_730 [Microbotryum intermedium]
MDGASLVETPDGTRDKYIGLALAISSSIAIGTSFIITKKGLISAADRHDGLSSSTNYSYLKNGLWWAGMITMVAGEVANFAAYCFAPPILVTPLGAGSVLVGAVLASFFLGEQLGRIGISGCSLCLVGSLIIVLHAPEDKAIETVDEVLAYALQPGFLFYCFFVLVFSVYMIYRVAPVSGSSNPLVYISICSLVGSVSVMAVKGFGVALKLTIAGNNQLWRPGTWVFAITVVGCIAVQMNYFNKALDLFPTTVVNPSYFVGFSTSTLIASIILFHGLNTSGGKDTLSLLCGLYVISLGVYLLVSSAPLRPRRHKQARLTTCHMQNLSRSENENSSGGLTRLNRHSHSMLDNGILGRTSLASNRYSMNSDVEGNPEARKSTNLFRGGGAVVGGVEPLYRANDVHLRMEEFEDEDEDEEFDEDDDEQGTSYRHKGEASNGTR